MSKTESSATPGPSQSVQPRRQISGFKRFRKVFFGRPVVLVGITIIFILAIMAIFSAWIAPYDPYEQNLGRILEGPSRDHLVGTDTLGRDVLSRIIYGSRTSIIIGFMAVSIAALIGMSLGLVAGYMGGIVGMIIMRLIDAMMNFPMILLALLMAALLGGGMTNIIVALGISSIPPYARLMFGQAVSIRENDYVLAARSLRASNIRIMLRHVAPNAFPPLIVMMTMQIGGTILAEAGLSFLGVGIKPPGAAWGAMVSEGYRYLLTNPELSIAPGFCIMLVVFGYNMVGDGLRDALDPRLRGTL